MRGLVPAVPFGFDFFHGEVGAFDEADFDGGTARGDAALRPCGEGALGVDGIGKVGLEDEAGGEMVELGFVEDVTEGGHGEMEVAVFFHVEVDEFVIRERGAVEPAKAIFDGVEGGVPGNEIDLAEDGGDFDGDVIDVGPGEEIEDGVEAAGGFFFAEDGFAELVQIYPGVVLATGF